MYLHVSVSVMFILLHEQGKEGRREGLREGKEVDLFLLYHYTRTMTTTGRILIFWPLITWNYACTQFQDNHNNYNNNTIHNHLDNQRYWHNPGIECHKRGSTRMDTREEEGGSRLASVMTRSPPLISFKDLRQICFKYVKILCYD